MEEEHDIGWAMNQMRDGKRVRRDAWHQAQCVYLVNGSQFTVNRPPLNHHYPEGTVIDYDPHVDYSWASRTCGVYTWTQGDVLARDWTLA